MEVVKITKNNNLGQIHCFALYLIDFGVDIYLFEVKENPFLEVL